MTMTREHKTAIILLMLIVALYPWAMDNHDSHDPKTMADLKTEIVDLEYVELDKTPKQDYNDATKPGPHSGGYDAWKSSVIPLENTEN